MHAEFEHDRRILNLCFYNARLGGVDQVKLVIRYSAIRYAIYLIIIRFVCINYFVICRQIFWEMTDEGRDIRHKLHLRIGHPPIVRKTPDLFDTRPKKAWQKDKTIRYHHRSKFVRKNKKKEQVERINTEDVTEHQEEQTKKPKKLKKMELRCRGTWAEEDPDIYESLRDAPVLTLELHPV